MRNLLSLCCEALHFLTDDVSLDDLVSGDFQQLGDFVASPYEAVLRRAADRVQVRLTREGTVQGVPLRLSKGITLFAEQSVLEIGPTICWPSATSTENDSPPWPLLTALLENCARSWLKSWA